MYDQLVSVWVVGALLMSIQYLRIAVRKERPNTWHRTLIKYRNGWRWTLTLVAVFAVAGAVLISTQDTNRLVRSSSSDQAGVSLAMLFAIGLIRLFIERARGESEGFFAGMRDFVRSFVNPRKLMGTAEPLKIHVGGGKEQTFWLAFFIVFFVSSLFIDDSIANQDETVLAWMLLVLTALGYFCWIYMLLFRKLTDEHHFTARATRIFLGDIFTGEIPRQAILIGPPGAGKTTLVHADTKYDATQSVTIVVKAVAVEDPTSRPVMLSMIDCPGENMRDYVLLSSAFRADVLVLMLNARCLDPESLRDPGKFTMDRWGELVLDMEEMSDQRTYLQALHFATHGEKQRQAGTDGNKKSDERYDKAIDISGLFRARSFVLYLNKPDNHEGAKNAIDALNMNGLKNLAVEIGSRFGVSEAASFCYVGDCAKAGQGRDVIADETRLRQGHAALIE